jgi:dipeptidase
LDKGCFMMAAGKSATVDGSVMVARSCDALGDYAQQVRAVGRKRHVRGEKLRFEDQGVVIAQAPETFAYIAVMGVIEGEDISQANGGINEYQVCAGASTGGLLNAKAEEVSPKMPTSIGDYRCTLVLERCKTARSGIKLIGELTEKYGARTDNYIVTDPHEAWFYEEYQGKLWAAVRVPDDCFVIQANTVRIDRVNFDDPDNFMGSKDLVNFAIKNGLYDPKCKAAFSPMKVYGAQKGKIRLGIPAPEYDRRRIWRGMSLLAPSAKLNPEEPSWIYPLFVRPDRKLLPKDFLNLMTDRYDGTKYDRYSANKKLYKPVGMVEQPENAAGSRKVVTTSAFHINDRREYQLAPIWGLERIIGTPRAVTTWCAQLRDWMPNQIGGLLWAGISEGNTGGRIPWYCGITRTPEAYNIGIQKTGPMPELPFEGSIFDERSAYWIFREVSNLVNLFYTATIEEVNPAWRHWEEGLFNLQDEVEKTALELYRKNPNSATEFITTYSNAKAIEALDMARRMISRLHTIIAHYNAPL